MVRNNVFARLYRAKDMLREIHDDSLSIDDVAREAAVSPYHFIRLFKSAFGQTPHEFRICVRLDMAKQLLITGDYSVTDVCMELGYSSVGSFSTLFAQRVGVSPTSFRRQLRSMVQVPGMFPRELMPYCFALMYGSRSL